ncbi:MAG: membrane protein insertase YidC, partial [Polyangiaceae bacterium]|nr:membrane protein insertase YidC [Polyangiaceae bacterium]
MERSALLRIVIIVGLVAAGYYFLPKLWGGGDSGTSGLQPLGSESVCSSQGPCVPMDCDSSGANCKAKERKGEELCKLQGNRFAAQFSTRGASLKSFQLDGEKYKEKDDGGPKSGKQIDLVTVPDVEQRRPLRFDWRGAGAVGKEDAQVPYDAFDWELVEKSPQRCVFAYKEEGIVELRKVVKTGERPFEIEVEASIKNISETTRKHALSVEVTTWRYHTEVDSHFGRPSPHMTHVSCAYDGDMTRKGISDFAPGDFKKDGFEGGWFVNRGSVSHAAVSDYYFALALVPLDPGAVGCMMQIEERWDSATYKSKTKDSKFGAMYRSRLSYPLKDLAPGVGATYRVSTFVGPKERDVLAGAASGSHRLS